MPTLPNRHFATPKPSQLIQNPSKMAKQHSLLSLSLCMLVLIQGSLAIGLYRPRVTAEEYYRRQRICQFDRLEALDPDNKVEAEAGITETWNPNHDQFQCAGVAVVRRSMEPNALHLPSYTNTPQLTYIVRGKGVVGTIFPGCAETYEEGQRAAVEVSVSGSQVDRHQKLQHVREGDVIVIPAGVAYWSYNSGNEPLIAVTLHDTNDVQNQLDQFPSRFYLAGNPQDEFSRPQLQRYMTPLDPRWHGLRTTEKKNNMFRGFNSRFLEEAFDIDSATVTRLQGQDDYRNDIIRVKGKLDLVSPVMRPSRETQQERQYQEERELERDLERQQEQSWTRSRGGYDYGYGNGLEETFCTMRLKENIGDPSRSDIFNPQAGRISTVNSFNLPILQYLRLSAERGHLYQNGIYTPHWNQNAHSVMYVIRGRGRVQVVDHYGQTFFDGEVSQGQILVIPQNHAVVKQATNKGFEWVSFKTNDNAWISPLAGRTSVIRALPEAVLMNSFQITREQAQRLKYNREETFLLSPSGSPRERREDIAKM